MNAILASEPELFGTMSAERWNEAKGDAVMGDSRGWDLLATGLELLTSNL